LSLDSSGKGTEVVPWVVAVDRARIQRQAVGPYCSRSTVIGFTAWLGELAPRTPPKRRRQRQDHSGHHRWVQRFHVVKAGPPPLSASPVEPYGAKEQVGAEQPRCSSKAGWRLSHVSPWSDSQRRV